MNSDQEPDYLTNILLSVFIPVGVMACLCVYLGCGLIVNYCFEPKINRDSTLNEEEDVEDGARFTGSGVRLGENQNTAPMERYHEQTATISSFQMVGETNNLGPNRASNRVDRTIVDYGDDDRQESTTSSSSSSENLDTTDQMNTADLNISIKQRTGSSSKKNRARNSPSSMRKSNKKGFSNLKEEEEDEDSDENKDFNFNNKFLRKPSSEAEIVPVILKKSLYRIPYESLEVVKDVTDIRPFNELEPELKGLFKYTRVKMKSENGGGYSSVSTVNPKRLLMKEFKYSKLHNVGLINQSMITDFEEYAHSISSVQHSALNDLVGLSLHQSKKKKKKQSIGIISGYQQKYKTVFHYMRKLKKVDEDVVPREQSLLVDSSPMHVIAVAEKIKWLTQVCDLLNRLHSKNMMVYDLCGKHVLMDDIRDARVTALTFSKFFCKKKWISRPTIAPEIYTQYLNIGNDETKLFMDQSLRKICNNNDLSVDMFAFGYICVQFLCEVFDDGDLITDTITELELETDEDLMMNGEQKSMRKNVKLVRMIKPLLVDQVIKMDGELGGMILSCVDNNPKNRPSSFEFLQALKRSKLRNY